MSQLLRRSLDDVLLAAIIILAVASALAVAIDLPANSRSRHVGQEFQSLLGGLGMGCQTDLAHCSWQFDPRLMGDDDSPLDVILGSNETNPWHSISLFPAPSNRFDGDAAQEINNGGAATASPEPPLPNSQR
jgi:hypothetical protein